jgi:hypothetical protein
MVERRIAHESKSSAPERKATDARALEKEMDII